MSNADQHIDTLVIGLGKTGLSCVRFLKQQGQSVAVTDTRDKPPCLPALKEEYPDVSFVAGTIDAELCRRAEQIVVSPGVSLQQAPIQQAISEGKPVYGDIELFCQQARSPIIAITGSNGKSTVTTLVAKMAEAAGIEIGLGGNVGTPALELLLEPVPRFYVLELSSFQLDSTFSLNAFASVVLNVSSDHMDRYQNIEHYARSKQKIYSGDGVMVINRDDPRVVAMQTASRPCLSFSLQEKSEADFGLRREDNELWLCHGKDKIITAAELGIKGQHNIANALAAMALGSVMHIPYSAMTYTLSSFHGLAHRCQFVANISDIDWINDSKATNVGASIAAIEGIDQPGRIILIAGGDSKGADVSPLLPVLQQHVKHVYLLGADARRFATLIDGHVPFTLVSDMEQAVRAAAGTAVAGDTVLLAPACASLDMYQSYQQRGEAFVAAVEQLEQAG